jgi:hypothetical protein
MSKKRQIRPLSTLALGDLASLIVEAVGATLQAQLELIVEPDEINIVMVEINSYLDNSGATSNVYEDLLKVILNSDALEASIRFTCMQMLLNESVQSLSTEVFPFSYYEKILQVIAAQGHGLRNLNMKGVWVKEENMNFMYAVVKNLPNLTRLSIPYIANDELLKFLAEHSTKLKYLDISGETDITEIGIESLCLGGSKDSLTVVDIGTLGEENICHTDIAFMLTQLPNLANLMTYSFTGKALQYVLDKINPQFKSKLQYLHDTDTKTSTLEAVARTCPNLEHIYLDSPAPGSLHHMKTMKLKRLKICKFSCSELLQLLDEIGKYLVHLTVIKGAGNLDIGRLVRSCCCLMDLDFYLMDALTYLYERSFPQLEGLEILNSPLAAICLRSFICNTTTLKRIAVDQISFNDEDMHR